MPQIRRLFGIIKAWPDNSISHVMCNHIQNSDFSPFYLNMYRLCQNRYQIRNQHKKLHRTGARNFGPRIFRPGISARCEMKIRVRVIRFYNKKIFSVGRKSGSEKSLGRNSCNPIEPCIIDPSEKTLFFGQNIGTIVL